MVDGEAKVIIVKQLTYGNANAICQTAIDPNLKKEISIYIHLYVNLGSSYTQGLSLAMVFQGSVVPQLLAGVQQ